MNENDIAFFQCAIIVSVVFNSNFDRIVNTLQPVQAADTKLAYNSCPSFFVGLNKHDTIPAKRGQEMFPDSTGLIFLGNRTDSITSFLKDCIQSRLTGPGPYKHRVFK